jgi:hypothetical protein
VIRKVVRVHGHGQCDERNDHDDPDDRGFSFVVVVAVYSNPSGGAAPSIRPRHGFKEHVV